MQEKNSTNVNSNEPRALVANGATDHRKSKNKVICYYCRKPAHFKKECRKYLASKKQESKSVEEALVTMHAFSATSKSSWIVDSGATCNMCNNKSLFVKLQQLATPQEVTLGDGHSLEGTAIGTVKLEMLLPDGGTTICTLNNVLFVPELSYIAF